MLPPGVQLLVRSRRRVLAGRARGRVLDLGGAESHASLWANHEPRSPEDRTAVRLGATFEQELAGLVETDEQFDTVFSAFRLVAVADLDAALARLRRLLHPDGQLLFLEPARRAGTTGRAQRLAAPGITMATGWRVGRDIPAALRTASLSVTDLDRHRIKTVQWWLRRVVEGVAHHALPPGGSGE